MNHSITVADQWISADNRDPVVVVLFNHSDVDFEVKVGDYIALLILTNVVTPNLTVVEDEAENV